MTGRALVVGAGGFIGSHLTRRLLDLGWDVTGVVRESTAPHVRARLSDVADDVHVVERDAFDVAQLAPLVRRADVVYPLAGHSGATRSLREPMEDVAANAVGQLAVLEALRHHNPEARTVFAGSRLQYGPAKRLPVTEDHPQEPTSLYGLHKMVGERYHLLYHSLYGIRTCAVRISNPYGPHQDRPDQAFGIVGTFLACAARGDAIRLYGGGHQARDYVFVDDLVDLLIRATTNPVAVGEVFNASGPEPTTLRQMADCVIETVRRGATRDVPWPQLDAAIETGDYVGDWRKAERVLGWTPTTSLAEGLAVTWEALAPLLPSAAV